MTLRLRSTLTLLGLIAPLWTAETLHAVEVGRYLFEEGSGPALDSAPASGAENGVLGSGATYLASPGHPTGGAFVMDFSGGTGGYIDLGAVDFLNGATGATLATWLNLDLINTTNATHLIHISGGSALSQARAILRFTPGGVINAGGRSSDTDSPAQLLSSSQNLSDLGITTGQWFHLAMTMDYATDSVRLFLNGSPVPTTGSVNFSQSTASNTDSLGASLGAGVTGSGTPTFNNFINGQMDDVRIFDSALSDSEIQALAIPEPATAGLLGLGALVLAGRRRRHQ